MIVRQKTELHVITVPHNSQAIVLEKLHDIIVTLRTQQAVFHVGQAVLACNHYAIKDGTKGTVVKINQPYVGSRSLAVISVHFPTLPQPNHIVLCRPQDLQSIS